MNKDYNAVIYYAVIDEYEIVDDGDNTKIVARFDGLLAEDTISYGAKSLDSINTHFLTVDGLPVEYQKLCDTSNFAWVEIAVTRCEGGNVSIITNVGSEENYGNLQNISALHRDHAEELNLEYTLSHPSFKSCMVEIDKIKEVIEKNTAIKQADALFIHYVGQGSAATLNNSKKYTSYSYTPECYFDVGGDIYRRGGSECLSKLYHTKLNDDAFIILSHWDLDHWISAHKYEELQKLSWIAPFQKIGPTHAKMANKIKKNDKLFLWCDDIGDSVLTKNLCIYKLENNNNRNYSGLCTVLKSPSTNILIPGDAPYDRCGKIINKHIVNIVIVPHHGGKSRNGFNLSKFNLNDVKLAISLKEY